MAERGKYIIMNVLVVIGFAVSALASAFLFLAESAVAFAGSLIDRGVSLEFIVGARDYGRPVKRRPF
jgi:hypothetical protein